FFVRVGRNDHKELLHIIAVSERGVFGFVIDAQNADRHRELITEARKRSYHVILDPKTQPMGLPGGLTDGLAALPWGPQGSHHQLSDFDGSAGQDKAAR